MIEIEKGVPMPERGKGPGRARKYPIAEMEVGDSFLVEKKERQNVNTSFMRCGFKACTRNEGDKVRVWRIA